MKATVFTVVLLCTSLTSAFPYSPYADKRGELKYAEWGQDAVSAYLRSKMAKENIQPEALSEYIVGLTQGKKPPPSDTTTPNPDVTKSR